MAEEIIVDLPILRNCPHCGKILLQNYSVTILVHWRSRRVEGGEICGMRQEAHGCGPHSNIAQIIERGA